MNTIFYSICYLSVLLLIGTFIRSKIKLLQELFIPASVIGGLIGLIIGSTFIPDTWLTEIALFPGILIIPIIASVPLGLEFKGITGKSATRDIGIMSAIMLLVTFTQIFIGYSTNLIFNNLFSFNIYNTFGTELNAGFSGGHGTAGMIGRILKDMNMDYWAIAQGIATTTATFGLIGGIILGIFLINRSVKSSSIPAELKKGYYTDILKQESLGRETMLSSSVDTLAFHISIIFSVCGLAFIILNFFKKYKIPVLSSISVWVIAMILMFGVWKLIKVLKLEWCVDSKVKTRLSSLLTEFAIISAVTTLPFKAVFYYAVPIFTMLILGFISTWFIIKYFSYKYFKNNYPFERFIAMLGTSLGIFLTGLLLLRICDSEFSTPVLGDYSLAFSITALTGTILIATCINLSFQYGPIAPIFLNLIFIFVTIILIKKLNSIGCE